MSTDFRFTIETDKCRGCRRCEIACTWQNGFVDLTMSAIHVYTIDEKGKNYPVISTVCQERFCGKLPLAQSENNREKLPVPRCVSSCLFGALNFTWEVE
jgi:Fe-S-cluster-containing dehydrogenase component